MSRFFAGEQGWGRLSSLACILVLLGWAAAILGLQAGVLLAYVGIGMTGFIFMAWLLGFLRKA